MRLVHATLLLSRFSSRVDPQVARTSRVEACAAGDDAPLGSTELDPQVLADVRQWQLEYIAQKAEEWRPEHLIPLGGKSAEEYIGYSVRNQMEIAAKDRLRRRDADKMKKTQLRAARLQRLAELQGEQAGSGAGLPALSAVPDGAVEVVEMSSVKAETIRAVGDLLEGRRQEVDALTTQLIEAGVKELVAFVARKAANNTIVWTDVQKN